MNVLVVTWIKPLHDLAKRSISSVHVQTTLGMAVLMLFSFMLMHSHTVVEAKSLALRGLYLGAESDQVCNRCRNYDLQSIESL
jgi:hypothetical protein